MTKTVHGIIRGNSIELTETLGVAEGQEVEVQVTLIGVNRKWGAGITRSAGALVDDPDWDGIMDEVHGMRKLERRTPLEDK